MLDLYALQWWVPIGGFRWVEHDTYDGCSPGPGAAPQLTPYLVSNKKLLGTRIYNPIPDDALYARFANTPLTLAGVKRFADTYGLLHRDRDHHVLIEVPGEEVPAQGESFHLWVNEIREMRLLLEVQKMLSNGDAFARKSMSWNDAEGRLTIPAPGGEDNQSAFPPGLHLAYARFVYAEAHASASGSAISITDDWLAGGAFREADLPMAAASRLLHHIIEKKLERHARVAFYSDPPISKPAVRIVPDSLLGALWTQFAIALSEGWQPRLCSVCHEPFRPVRSHAETCSNKCRTRRSRQKRGLHQ